MKINSINLNLLKTLYTLFQTKSVTLTSQRLFITQPAVSKSLKQLREIFNDELFVRTNGQSLRPTFKAKQIQNDLSDLFAGLEKIFQDSSKEIDLKNTKSTIQIGSHARVNMMMLPLLQKTLSEHAPKLLIIQNNLSDLSKPTITEYTEYDLLIGQHLENIKYFKSELLFSSNIICVSGNQTLNKKDKLTKEDLMTHKHVVLTYYDNYRDSQINQVLIKNNIVRNTNMIVYDANIAAEIASKDQLLFIDLDLHTEDFLKKYQLKKFKLPFHTDPKPYYVAYQTFDEYNPLIQWLKEQIKSIFKKQ